jgi:hypothetical protein
MANFLGAPPDVNTLSKYAGGSVHPKATTKFPGGIPATAILKPSRPAATGNGGAGTTGPALGTGTTTDANGNPITDQDAVAIISSELTSWGFGQDAVQWATQQIQSNNSIDQILYSMRQQQFYVNSIFGQVAKARTAAGLPAMTEAQILSYQDYATGVAQQAGLPQGFINTNELVTLMGHDVSTTELDARITQGLTAALKAPPDVLKQFQDDYGVGPGGLAAYYLNPETALPLLQNQFTAAQIGAEATRTGYGAIGADQQMALAQMGVTDSSAQKGFEDLAKQSQLFTALPGSAEQAIAEPVQLGAEFGGNAPDAQAIAERAQQREAVFQGNYHFAETQNRGITGLGATPRNG